MFLFCATSFGVVLTMGGLRYANVETEIYLLTTQELDLTGAAALSVLQLLVITVLLALSARVRRSPGPVDRITRRQPRPGPRHLPVLCSGRRAVVVFLMAPLASLVSASLRRGEQWGLENYRALGTTGARNALLVPATEGLATPCVIALAASSIALVPRVVGGLPGLASLAAVGAWPCSTGCSCCPWGSRRSRSASAS